jgi:hypothetical protein
MGGGGNWSASPFRTKIEKWKAVGGGIDSNGEIIEQPWELMKARFIDNVCQRYSCLPSQLMNEDIDMLMQMHKILDLAGDGQEDHQTMANPMEQSLANMSRRL